MCKSNVAMPNLTACSGSQAPRIGARQDSRRQNTVAVLNIEPLGTIFVGEKRKEVSMVFGSFPQKKESQVVQ
jgi:hypothetical protein